MTTSTPSRESSSIQPRLGLALVVIAAAQLMVVLDATIVNVALPSIQSSLRFSSANLVWVTTSYSLTFGGLLLFGGRTGDLFGRRRMFMVGIAIFSVASLLGGFATGQAWLIGARALQGVGAAIAAPTALSLIATNFPEGKSRNRAMGVYAAMAGAGGALGLLLGGVLTDIASWEWVLFVNVPIGALVLLVTPWALRESEGGSGRLDVPGTLTVSGGMALLVYGLTNAASHSWSSTGTLIALASSGALLVTFLLIEVWTPHALMPMRIFSNRNRSGAYVVMLCVGASLFGTFFFLTQYLQDVKGYSPLATGVGFLPLMAVIGVTTQIASLLVGRIGVRPLLLVGTAAAAGGLFWLSFITVDSSYWDVIVRLAVMGFGVGLTFVPLTLTAVAGVDRQETGLASALLNTAQQIGGAVGLSVLSTIAVTAIKNKLSALHGPPTHHLVAVATTHGYTQGFLVAAGICAFAFVIAVIVIRVPRALIGSAESSAQEAAAMVEPPVGTAREDENPAGSPSPAPPSLDAVSTTPTVPPSPKVVGWVHRADGVALSKTSMTVIDTAGRHCGRTTTDSRGWYECLVPGNGEYLMVCSCPPYEPQAVRVLVETPSVRCDMVLTGAVDLSGRVLAAGTLAPLPDALLVLTDRRGVTVARTLSDESGCYELSELVEGSYTLTTCYGAHPPMAASVMLPAANSLVRDVILHLPPPLAGTVRSAMTGLALPEAMVTVLNSDGQVVARTYTERDGTFGVDNLVEGDYTIIASGYPSTDTVAALRRGPITPVEMTLGPAAR